MNRTRTFQICRAVRAFTLFELILTMALLTIVISLSAPSLANFFRGRSLDSEARRVLALTREGQSRAVSEGVPVELWIDSSLKRFGLEAEPAFEPEDARALEFELAPDMTLEASETKGSRPTSAFSRSFSDTNDESTKTRRPQLPRIRFQPDGTIAESSPTTLILTGQDGFAIHIAQSRTRLHYEIQPSRR